MPLYEQLPHLIWLRLTPDLLKIQEFRDGRMNEEDVVTSAHP